MKFSKLTKKLLLSALSLGLAVVTLTTTTYAWYTTNTEVSATAKGSTSAASNDASLLISNAENGTYGPTVDLSTVAKELLPIQWDSSSNTFEDKAGVESTAYITITVYFKISQALTAETPIYLSNLTIENTGDLTEYDNLASANNIEGCPTGLYTVDAVNALDLVIGEVAYDLSGKLGAADASAYFNGTPNALTYYNEVMNLEGEDALDENDETAEFEDFDYTTMDAVATISAGETKASATLKIYLNGWDKYCFDACRDQDFDITLNFSTKKPE